MQTGHVIPFGDIHVFVGYIFNSPSSSQAGDSEEEGSEGSMDSRSFGSIVPLFEKSYEDYIRENSLASDAEEAPIGIYMAGGASTSGS